MKEVKKNAIYGGIVGLSIGDALGVPVEFRARPILDADPVTGFRSGGSYGQPEGIWSDDTSLTLALLDSLSTGLEYGDIAGKFIACAREADYTATAEVFDISSMTHGHLRSKITCFLYSEIIRKLFNSFEKEEALESAYHNVTSTLDEKEQNELTHFTRCRQHIKEISREMISSDGYVVSTLEAGLWSFLSTKSFREAVLRAVNLGEDTDTTGAVTGSLAGCYYGSESIPSDWIGMLKRSEYIEGLCENFVKFLDE